MALNYLKPMIFTFLNSRGRMNSLLSWCYSKPLNQSMKITKQIIFTFLPLRGTGCDGLVKVQVSLDLDILALKETGLMYISTCLANTECHQDQKHNKLLAYMVKNTDFRREFLAHLSKYGKLL